MKGRKPTKEEQDFMDEICQIGCIVCRTKGIYTPLCSPHHMEGKTKPGAHFKVIPLCAAHHQVPDTRKPPAWVSRHGSNGNGKKEFEDRYGTEMELYHLALELLEHDKKLKSVF